MFCVRFCCLRARNCDDIVLTVIRPFADCGHAALKWGAAVAPIERHPCGSGGTTVIGFYNDHACDLSEPARWNSALDGSAKRRGRPDRTLFCHAGRDGPEWCSTVGALLFRPGAMVGSPAAEP